VRGPRRGAGTRQFVHRCHAFSSPAIWSNVFVGTPEQLADHATAWQDAGAARRAAREKIVEAGHADFFDHSVVETILGSDLRAKSYAPGAWLGFNPDFVYRHRQ
jgi:alkanesulfonate monooxygenase SsuD/methylene tetrahydromethanopterin reductase-like flavin-dependent oxidoreductase (luciferase family)